MVKVEGLTLVFNPLEQLICFERKLEIPINLVKSIKVVDKIKWIDEYSLRFGINIPGLIKVGNFYKPKKDRRVFVAIFSTIVFVLPIVGMDGCCPYLLLALLSFFIPYELLFIKRYLDKRFSKQFCYITPRSNKYLVVEFQEGFYKFDRIIIALNEETKKLLELVRRVGTADANNISS